MGSFEWTNSLAVASDVLPPQLRSQSLRFDRDTEGKPLKSELACAVIGKRVGVWSVPNLGYGAINSLSKCESA